MSEAETGQESLTLELPAYVVAWLKDQALDIQAEMRRAEPRAVVTAEIFAAQIVEHYHLNDKGAGQ
jgi:hypothetical protein